MSTNKDRKYQKCENLVERMRHESIQATWLQIGATGCSDNLLAELIPSDQMFGADIPECFPDRLAFFRWWICRSIMLKNLSILHKNKIPADIKQVLNALEADPEQAYSLFCKYPFIFDVKKQFKRESKTICNEQDQKIVAEKQRQHEIVKKWVTDFINHADKSNKEGETHDK